MQTSIGLYDVWEKYHIKFLEDSKVVWEDFWALKDVTIEIGPGEAVGVIGPNGSGKSTLLKLIKGILSPDKGKVTVNGRVAGLFELGAGFQIELTGRENIFLVSALFGLSRQEVEGVYDDIVSFADIGRFINASVKYYSQGMFVRLAFSIAIHSKPDILLVDDTLSVGDEYFQRKCLKKLFEAKEQSSNLVFVTHDMHMLSRLCKRAVFLENGRIVKDSGVEQVAILYSQMSGPFEAVAVINKGSLQVVFNNGRVYLHRDGAMLTSGSGLYLSFLLDGKLFASAKAQWSVDCRDNKITAKGIFFQLELSIFFCLWLDEDGHLRMTIDLESEKQFDIQEGFLTLMLSGKYEKWFTIFERGEFPQIQSDAKEWEHLLEENVFRKCIGVECVQAQQDALPALSLECSGYPSGINSQILNSDYRTNCRILQFKAHELRNFGPGAGMRREFISAVIKTGIADTVEYVDKIWDEFSLSSGDYRAVFENGRLIFTKSGRTIINTSYSIAYYAGRQYLSFHASWKVVKENQRKLTARSSWPGLPFDHIWEIELGDNAELSLKLAVECRQPVEIQEQYIWLEFPAMFDVWSCEYARGLFPAVFLDREFDVLQRCLPEGWLKLESLKPDIQGVKIDFSGPGTFAKIFNSSSRNRSRVALLGRVEPEGEKFAKGRTDLIDLRTSFHNGGVKQIIPGAEVINGKTRVALNEGSLRLLYENTELSKRLGIYTSVKAGGRWHDSLGGALWEIIESGNSYIKARASWVQLPFVQEWEISLVEAAITLCITMHLKREMVFERLQTNVMLIESYKEWFSEGKSGTFPEFDSRADDDWSCLSISKLGQDIGVRGRDLPEVSLSACSSDFPSEMRVINSDVYQRGRVLQSLCRDFRAVPGTYKYYTGTINIKDRK